MSLNVSRFIVLTPEELQVLKELQDSGGRVSFERFHPYRDIIYGLRDGFFVKIYRNGNVRVTAEGRRMLKDYRAALSV